MNRRITTTLAPALALALLIGAGVWWFKNFERVPEKTYIGLQGKARDDPYLAAKQLLQASGIQVTETSAAASAAAKFEQLPAKGTLLLGDRRHLLMNPARVERLLAWVAAGGHLLVEAEFPGRPDPLLTALGLTRGDLLRPARAATPAPGARPAPRGDKNAAPPPALERALPQSTALTTVALPDQARPLTVEFGAYQSLGDPRGLAQWRAADATGLRLVSMARGAGRVTAVSNLDWMTFRGTAGDHGHAQPAHIGRHDNAELLVRLVQQNPAHAASPLRLVWGDDQVSLWSWLSEHAWMAMAAAALLLALWLWRVVPRFGPLKADAPPADQRLIGHVEASGRFYWKHLTPAAIYLILRGAFMQRLAERRPGLAEQAAVARNAELAQLIGARAEAVARALDAPVRGTGDFIRNTVLLQRISQKL